MQGLGNFIPLLILIAVMYFFIIRPQQKQNKERQQMLNSLEKGDRIVTAGGIHGKITSVKDDTINLEIAPNVVITLQKSGVGFVKTDEEEKPRKGKKKKNEEKTEDKNEVAEPEDTAQEETSEENKGE